MRIQHNIMAMNAYRNYTNNVSAMKANLEKLSSGYKINRAGDDAAGLAISEKMRAQITGLETAQKNAKDGISLVQTAEGALTEVHDMLNRMVELSTQSANGTYDNETDRAQMQKELDQLRSEINRIADSSNFNGIKLLDGSMSGSTAGGAISNVVTNQYEKATSSLDAFNIQYVTNRPGSAAAGGKASFEVSLDDMGVKGGKASDRHAYTLTIGDHKFEVTGTGATWTATQIATAIKATGKALASSDATNNTLGTSSGAHVMINGNIYKMSGTGNKITFTQVNEMKDGTAPVNPNFKVDGDAKTNLTTSGTGNKSGTVNWQVQKPGTGSVDGDDHQAQVEIAIDFTKLKDGDKLKVGAATYTFSIGSNSNYTTASNRIDLTKIFASEDDMRSSNLQEEAMVKIAAAMDGNTNWTVGNGGVSGKNKGTLTFQSKSTPDNTTYDLSTEEKVMAQFAGKADAKNANTTFDIDVSKIKVGDTVKIGDKTYEFVDGGSATGNNVAVDLSSLNIADGIDKNTANTKSVVDALKAAIAKDTFEGTSSGTAKYTVTQHGDTVTITANDWGTTGQVYENKEIVKVGAGEGGLVLQIGDTAESYNQLRVSIGDAHTKALGLDDISIAEQDDALAAIDVIKQAINKVSDIRGTLGATQNRLDHTINNLSVMTENIQDAESTIRDTDVAEEMMAYTKNNILIQSAQAMLAQANQVPQGVLQLLQ